MVKPALLRQDVLAGVGNIMADETLWRAEIHPRARLETLTDADLKRLWRALAVTTHSMLGAGGTSLRDWKHPDGKRGRFQERRRVYGKAGKPCPRCGTKLVRVVVGGRGTTICLRCQRRRR
jgi:formamidopyrimidine-DNA glycosylase